MVESSERGLLQHCAAAERSHEKVEQRELMEQEGDFDL